MLIPLIEWLCSASVSFLAESWLLTWPHGIFMFRSCWTPVEPPVVLPLYDNGHGPPTTSLCSGPHWFRLSPNVHPKSYMMEHTSLMLESASGGFCMFLLPRPIQLQLSKWKLPTSNVAVEHAPFRSITYPSDKKPSMAIVVQGISKVHNLHLAQGINRICQSFPMISLWFSYDFRDFHFTLGQKSPPKSTAPAAKHTAPAAADGAARKSSHWRASIMVWDGWWTSWPPTTITFWGFIDMNRRGLRN